MAKLRLKIALLSYLLCLFLSVRTNTMAAPLFTSTLFSVRPQSVQIGYNSGFSINVTNLQNRSIWVFCIAQDNISRVDAPVFLTMNPNQTYIYQFISPNETLSTTTSYNSTSALENATYANLYTIYFSAVDSQGTQFQTSQVSIQITTVQSLQYLLQQIVLQNALLQSEVTDLQNKASSNNPLIAVAVGCNLFWPCVFLYVRYGKKRTESQAQIHPEPEVPSS
jgi:hypothetical protein